MLHLIIICSLDSLAKKHKLIFQSDKKYNISKSSYYPCGGPLVSDVEKLFPDDEMDAETERLVYRITEGLQRLNSIGTVQYIQISWSTGGVTI